METVRASVSQQQSALLAQLRCGGSALRSTVRAPYVLPPRAQPPRAAPRGFAAAAALEPFVAAAALEVPLGAGEVPRALSSVLADAAKQAVQGGAAGAMAMGVNVGALMWMRTIVQYQYRCGAARAQHRAHSPAARGHARHAAR